MRKADSTASDSGRQECLENRLFMMVERSTIRRATSYKESHTVLWKVKDKVSFIQNRGIKILSLTHGAIRLKLGKIK